MLNHIEINIISVILSSIVFLYIYCLINWPRNTLYATLFFAFGIIQIFTQEMLKVYYDLSKWWTAIFWIIGYSIIIHCWRNPKKKAKRINVEEFIEKTRKE